MSGSRLHPRCLALLVALVSVSGCATSPSFKASDGRVWDPKLGVWSSPRLVADGDAVPRGGGSYLVGRPYVIGGRTYVPTQNPSGYTAEGTASWYGDAFHGRRTANGEIFDKGSISAAHPTLPLPSYVRVTNLKNRRSIVVRVNDRGPYHGGRVMDVSQRVADALQFRGEGTAHVRIEYVGRAPMQGSDDDRLFATLRTDGALAQVAGLSNDPPVVSARSDGTETAAQALAPVSSIVRQPDPRLELIRSRGVGDLVPRNDVPLPPPRPFTLGRIEDGGSAPEAGARSDRIAKLVDQPRPLAFADEPSGLAERMPAPFRRIDGLDMLAIGSDGRRTP